ncbi:hypothetical protein LZ31DRAFT_552231 [Colletotrichum somersetense]|nr:hypothetical protein LZ31DRAFT_552231 [Colletotrichum somersetense]
MVVRQVGDETWQGGYVPEPDFVANPVLSMVLFCTYVVVTALLRPNYSNVGYPPRYSVFLSVFVPSPASSFRVIS